MYRNNTLTVAVLSACAAFIVSETVRRLFSWLRRGAGEPQQDEVRSDETLPELGRNLREKEYAFLPHLHSMNNGSYACIPQRVLLAQQRLMKEREQSPEYWYRFRFLQMYKSAVKTVAEFVGVEPQNLVLVENVTSATNSIVKSFKFEAGDQVLLTNHTFGGVLTAMEFVTDMQPHVGLVRLKIPVQTTVQEIMDLYKKALDENQNIKLVIADHIASFSTVVFPIKQLIELCHSRGVIIAIDGAHAPGQLLLHLEELGADFYFGNLHKWLFAPRGCALFYIHPKHHSWIRSAVSSKYTFATDLHKRFHYVGTRDNTSYLTAEHAIAFHHYLGGLERIIAHNTELAYWAADMLAAAWNTTWIKLEPELRAPNMCLVVLPKTPKLAQYHCEGGNDDLIFDIAKEGVAVAITDDGEQMFLRVSAQVYNYREEYYILRDAIVKVLGFNG